MRGDVYQLLRQIPSLQPNCGMFGGVLLPNVALLRELSSCNHSHSGVLLCCVAHNDGTTSTLLNLEGTIPIFYRGNQYNIPVEFWIAESYPMAAPVCFVRPTAGTACGVEANTETVAETDPACSLL